MSKEDKKIADDLQAELKKVLGLEYLTKKKLDAYNANLFLLKDIWKNNKQSQIKYLGWDDPEKIPFYPEADSFKASSSLCKYNTDKLVMNAEMIEYDFTEAYTNIMRIYKLPSNTYLKNKPTTDKVLGRMSEHQANPSKHPYRELSTFWFIQMDIEAIRKESTYAKKGSMLSLYGDVLSARNLILSEIELKLIFDFYNVKKLEVTDGHMFRTRKGMLDDYFQRVDKLKDIEAFRKNKTYKKMRNNLYGQIGKLELGDYGKKVFSFPIYNRALSSMVAGVFRDMMIRFEQKYVNSEYDLLFIRTDGIYFRKEVPEFEILASKGVVKKKIHTIGDQEFQMADMNTYH